MKEDAIMSKMLFYFLLFAMRARGDYYLRSIEVERALFSHTISIMFCASLRAAAYFSSYCFMRERQRGAIRAILHYYFRDMLRAMLNHAILFLIAGDSTFILRRYFPFLMAEISRYYLRYEMRGRHFFLSYFTIIFSAIDAASLL